MSSMLRLQIKYRTIHFRSTYKYTAINLEKEWQALSLITKWLSHPTCPTLLYRNLIEIQWFQKFFAKTSKNYHFLAQPDLNWGNHRASRLFKSFKFGNGNRMSNENLVILNLNISRTKNGSNKLQKVLE